MNKLINFSFSAWRDGNRRACCIEADVPNSKIHRISFYMGADEFRAFCKGTAESFNDIQHNMRSYFGDHCTFYDMEFLTSEHGVMQVPYVNVSIPRFVRKALLRWAERRWKEETHMERPVIKISQERAERWIRLYGQGTGKIEIKMDETTKNFLNEKLVEPDAESLQNMICRIESIARNNTNTFFETGIVRLWKDWDGFNFAVEKNKRRFLYGGIVNHGRDGKPDWSIHT